MAQLVFVDGSFEELAQEFADYVHVGEEVKPLIEEGEQDEVLKKLVIASTALNAAPEKEFTAAYNLLVYLVLQSKNANMFLSRVCDNLMKPITTAPSNGPGLALGVLTNIFNMLEPNNDVRYHVFSAIVKFIRQNGQFEYLKKYLPQLKTWVEQWEIDEEDQRKLYVEIAEAAKDSGDDESSYEFILSSIKTFDADEVTSEEAQRLSLRAIKTAISSPTHFDFRDLTVLPAVQALSDSHSDMFELLDLFAEKDLEDYNDFLEEHSDLLEKEGLDADRLHRKMRLVTFASLAASVKDRQIPYARIEKALQIPEDDVEMWTIDVIRAGLVEGKLSQQQKVFLVHSTTYRVFGENQWRELNDRIDVWKKTLAEVAAALRREQAGAEANRKKEQDELERRLANAGMGDGPQRLGGDRGGRRGGDRGDRGDRPPPKPRTDDDD